MATDIWYHIIQLTISGLFGLALAWLKIGMDKNAKRQELLMQQELDRQEKARLAEMVRQEQQEAEKQELMYQILQSTTATRSLSRATAIAFKNGHCNGEIDRALKESDRVDKEQAALLQKIGVKNFF